LDAIEATSDEILGSYSKAEDEAMTVAFSARGKKRLNRVFDVIGFIYPDYCYPIYKHGRKREVAASVSASAPKTKKIKVLTHRPRCIETADVPKLIERAETTPTLVTETTSAIPVEVIADPVRVMESEQVVEKVSEQPKIMMVTALSKLSVATGTPRKRRMASVFEAVLESVKMMPPYAKAFGSKTEDVTKMIIASTSAHAEAGPSDTAPENLAEESLPENPSAPAPKAPSSSDLNFIVRHALGKQLST
jgi:hypothetical protein